MSRFEEKIEKLEGQKCFLDLMNTILDLEQEDLEEALQIERIVNLCNGVDCTEQEQEIIDFLYDNYFDRWELKFEILDIKIDLSDYKLLYLCDTGKTYD